MNFRQFFAVYLAIAISASAVITAIAPKIGVNYEVASLPHFSVRWMGFSPTDYCNSNPEYAIAIDSLKDNPLKMRIALRLSR